MQKIMMKALDEKNDPSRPGRIEVSTWGIVSPMTTCNSQKKRRKGVLDRIEAEYLKLVFSLTIKAHIPPKAKAPWKMETAVLPLRPKQ